MALDFGFVESLRGRDNWALARQDKQNAILYQSAAAQQQQRELAAQEKAIADANDYLSKLKNYQVFEPDLKKIRTVEEDARKDIEAQIKAYNGDVAKWMSEKGMTDLKKYGEKIVLSNEAQTGLGNAQAYAAWRADRDKGLLERFDIDEETLTPKNDFAKQFTEYTSGDRDRLEYRGAFKPNEFDDKYFSQVYGSTDRYSPKKVNETDYFNTIARDFVQKGMNPQDARQLAAIKTANYKKHLESGGTPLLYKWDKRPASTGGSGSGKDADRGLFDLLQGAYTGSRPDLINTEGYWDAGKAVKRYNPITKQTTEETRQYLPEFTQLNGRPLGVRTVADEKGNLSTKPNVIQQTFIVNRNSKDGKSLGKQFAVITDESRDRYSRGSASNPFVFFATPRAFFEAISIGSRSESGDATKTDKQLGTIETEEIDNDPLGVL